MTRTTKKSQKEHREAEARPAVYDLRGLAEDRNEGARCLPGESTSELKGIFAQLAAATDVEYPPPRTILEGEAALTHLLDQSERGSPRRGAQSAPTLPKEQSRLSEGSSARREIAGDAKDLLSVAAFAGASLSVLAAGVAIANEDFLILGLAAICLAICAIALVREWRKSRESRELAMADRDARIQRNPADARKPHGRGDLPSGGSSRPVALNSHAAPREAARIALSTGGLGLLMRPVNDRGALDQPEDRISSGAE